MKPIKHRKMLLVVHQAGSDPGRVGRMLAERGYELDVRCPSRGDPLPEDIEEYAGAVVFGGPMSANDGDTLPGIRAELEWIPGAVESGRPFLGICLGAQLLAKTLGAEVGPHPRGLAEIGYFPVRPTGHGAGLFGAPMGVYQWHTEGFDLPADAVLLAAGDRFPNQAFRYGTSAFGVQFHPEVTRDIMERWMQKAAYRFALPGAQRPEHQRSAHSRYDRLLEEWLDRFLDYWLQNEPRES